MKTHHIALLLPFLLAAAGITGVYGAGDPKAPVLPQPMAPGFGVNPELPPPEKSLLPTVHVAKAVGWPEGASPVPAAGLAVTRFAANLDHPRWLLVLPNGDVLVAESNAPDRPDNDKGFKGRVEGLVMKRAGAGVTSADRITLLRDANGDGIAELQQPFIENLYSPFGMALVGSRLYVANADAIVSFAYEPGQTRIASAPKPFAALPGGPRNHHWTKSLIASPDGKKLYVGVGSNSNIAEHGLAAEEGRAAIWEFDVATGAGRIFASGLRNPVGLAWQPESGALWVAVNERDELGNDLVPDYMTSVKDGGFYGWPWFYWGNHVDERVAPPEKGRPGGALVPDYALGAHTASLGLAAGRAGGALPAHYASGMFVGQHGSWNRRPFAGYKVIFVPFTGGKPAGAPEDVLTGFLDEDEHARGRPVGVALDARGALLVADDVGNAVWRVSTGGRATR